MHYMMQGLLQNNIWEGIMNEKIKGLLWKASLGYNDSWSQVDPEVLERFAKLIIEECSSLTLDYKNDEDYAGWIEYRELIKHHFGIKDE